MRGRIAGVALLLAAALAGQPLEYRIAPSEQNRFELIVEKTGLMTGRKHRFVIERYEGSLVYDPERPERSQVRLNIDARGIICKDTWVSAKDLRKIQEHALKEMLAADRFPALSFESHTVGPAASGRYEVEGTLTIRNTPKPAKVVLSVKSDPDGQLLLDGTAQVDMTDYGLKPPSAALGLIGTKKQMTVFFVLHAARETRSTGASEPR